MLQEVDMKEQDYEALKAIAHRLGDGDQEEKQVAAVLFSLLGAVKAKGNHLSVLCDFCWKLAETGRRNQSSK